MTVPIWYGFSKFFFMFTEIMGLILTCGASSNLRDVQVATLVHTLYHAKYGLDSIKTKILTAAHVFHALHMFCTHFYVSSPLTADRVIYDPKLSKNELSSFPAAI